MENNDRRQYDENNVIKDAKIEGYNLAILAVCFISLVISYFL